MHGLISDRLLKRFVGRLRHRPGLTRTSDAASEPDCDRSAGFESPPEGWQPPYPYHGNDVIFKQENCDEPKT